MTASARGQDGVGERGNSATAQQRAGRAAAAVLFAGPGEVCALARTLDWSATPLGWPDTWSPALRIATRAMLAAPHPICLWAGPEYALVYNDGYRRILAAKHPAALGQPGSTVWAEIWAELAPQFAQVSAGGPPVYGEDARFVMARLEGGGIEDAWFSYSLSPLWDEDGRIVAVYNISPETTARVRAEQALTAERARLFEAFQRVPSFASVVTGPDHVIEYANEAYYALVGRRDIVGLPVWEALPDARGQGFEALLDRVRDTGVPVVGREAPLHLVRTPGGAPEERFVDFAYQALTDADGTVWGVLGHGTDVTEHVRARREVERLLAESRAVNTQLEEQQLELELTNQQLQSQAAELETQTEALQQTAIEREARTVEAEAERARAAGILEAMADAYFELDRDFRIVAVNAAMERGTGFTRDALLGRVFWEMFPATVGTEYERHYRAAATTGATAHFTDAYDDGRLALVSEADVYPVMGGGVAVFWRDITARVRADAALRESEALARQLFARSPIPKWVYDAETLAFLDVNDAAVRHYGYTREEFLVMTIRDIRPPAEVPRMLAVAQAPHPTGGSHGIFHHRTRSGEIIEVEVFLRDVQYAGRRAVIAVVQDVTERRRAEAALLEASRAAAEARDAAEAANAAKSQFLSTMSHELRTPLNAIGGYTELLMLGLRGPLTDAQRQDLERVRLANQHLMSLVTDVLNFARLDAGQIEFRLADVELASIVADLEPLMGPQLAAKGLAFDHDGCAADTPNRPHRVRADPEKLRQILLNLLTNAVKFTDPGGHVALACNVAAPGGVTHVRVADTGRGIPTDQLERIFEPFVQVDRHRTHDSQQGVGLGLAISRDLARGMGGDLTVTSMPDVGSTFTLTLPTAP